jgi:hypothetical protein
MRFFKNFLLLLISLMLVLVGAEFVVRFAFSDITSTANMQSWFGMRWKDHYVVKNSLGYREREFSAQKADDLYRIVVIGDSFGFGQGLPVEDRFSNIMERELNRSEKKFEVLNVSLPGQRTADELVTLKEIVLPLDPDFVLIQWLPNDFEKLADTWRPRRASLVPNKKLHKQLNSVSALYFLLNNQWFNLRPYFGVENFDYRVNLMLPFKNPGSEEQQIAIQPMVELLDTLNGSGKDFAILLHPLLDLEMASAYSVQPMHDAVSELCQQMAATCLDATPAFVELGTDYDYSKLWVNIFDAHPGGESNQIIADFVLQELGPEFWEYKSD